MFNDSIQFKKKSNMVILYNILWYYVIMRSYVISNYLLILRLWNYIRYHDNKYRHQHSLLKCIPYSLFHQYRSSSILIVCIVSCIQYIHATYILKNIDKNQRIRSGELRDLDRRWRRCANWKNYYNCYYTNLFCNV